MNVLIAPLTHSIDALIARLHLDQSRARDLGDGDLLGLVEVGDIVTLEVCAEK